MERFQSYLPENDPYEIILKPFFRYRIYSLCKKLSNINTSYLYFDEDIWICRHERIDQRYFEILILTLPEFTVNIQN